MLGGLKMSYKGHACSHCRQVHHSFSLGNKTSSHDGGQYSDECYEEEYAGKELWGDAASSDEASRPHSSASNRQSKTMIMLFTPSGSGRGSDSSEAYMMSSGSLYDSMFTGATANDDMPTTSTSVTTPTTTVRRSHYM